MHLANPDEVFRTADYSMTIWYFIYAALELFIALKLGQFLFSKTFIKSEMSWYKKIPTGLSIFIFFGGSFFLLLRGGIQQIPLMAGKQFSKLLKPGYNTIPSILEVKS